MAVARDTVARDRGTVTAPTRLTIQPAQINLQGKTSRQQLLVTADVGGRPVDFTRRVNFGSSTIAVADVDEAGVVRPRGDGTGVVIVRLGALEARVPVQVRDADRFLAVDFENDVGPVLTRGGCNSGTCHGKARGQNGFRLSLLGFDPDFDYEAITREGKSRRVFPARPEHSLILRKPAARVPHGGGLRLEVKSAGYGLIRRWIASGMPRRQPDAPSLEGIEVAPVERLLTPTASQQLLVTARYSDGSRRDVTRLATYLSSESVIASVDERGLIRAGPLPGEAAIMARFQGRIAVSNVLIPLPGEVPASYYDELPRNNFIDHHVWEKLAKLALVASRPADDATYLRRVFLDVIGRLPTPDETRDFLTDVRQGKRARLVDRLLERPEYADFWASKWADLLRPNPYRVGIKAVFNLDAWLRESFRQNKRYDRFVREILSARGSTFRHGPTTVFRDRRSPEELTTMVSQLFLGIRLECARCHQHPFERWRQEDFYALAAYFSRVGRKGTGLSPPISGGEEMIFTSSSGGTLPHPLTGKALTPRPLFGEPPPLDETGDPREALASWLASRENVYFARVIANRLWGDLMGRGLVEPVDDLRDTNPPSNDPLLDALADHVRDADFDLKELIRAIATSYVYALSSEPEERNAADTRNYSRHYRVRLRAEVLLDAVVDVTQMPEAFSAVPARSRAMEIWTHRSPSLFLDTFGRPDPNQDPPCERTTDTSVVQALHLMNAPSLHEKITADDGRAARLAASDLGPEEIAMELYLLAYSRFPSTDEMAVTRRWFAADGRSRRQATEDLLWALLNSAEFVFKN